MEQSNKTNKYNPFFTGAQMFLQAEEWESASAYFQKILERDPQNAEAYLGRVMADLHVRDREELSKLRSPLFENRNFQNAVRYADEKLKKELIEYDSLIQYNNAVEVMNTAKDETGFNEAANLFRAILEFRNAAELSRICEEAGRALRNNKIYNEAFKALEVGIASKEYKKSKQDLETAELLFGQVLDWKDAGEKAKECEIRLKELEIAEQNRRNDELYNTAKHLLADSQPRQIYEFQKAQRLFMQVSGWRDSDLLANECEQRIIDSRRILEKEKLEQTEREAQERIRKENQAKKAKRTKIIIAVAMVSLIGIGILWLAVVQPFQKYQAAIAMLNSGNYDEAIIAFDQLGDYKDSNERIQECKQGKYVNATNSMENGNFDAAFAIFEALGDYENSSEMKKECRYRQAAQWYYKGKYEEALSIFDSLGDYSDSLMMSSQCQYDIGLNYYSEGNYQAAYQILSRLNYKDSDVISQEMIDSCLVSQWNSRFIDITPRTESSFGDIIEVSYWYSETKDWCDEMENEPVFIRIINAPEGFAIGQTYFEICNMFGRLTHVYVNEDDNYTFTFENSKVEFYFGELDDNDWYSAYFEQGEVPLDEAIAGINENAYCCGFTGTLSNIGIDSDIYGIGTDMLENDWLLDVLYYHFSYGSLLFDIYCNPKGDDPETYWDTDGGSIFRVWYDIWA